MPACSLCEKKRRTFRWIDKKTGRDHFLLEHGELIAAFISNVDVEDGPNVKNIEQWAAGMVTFINSEKS